MSRFVTMTKTNWTGCKIGSKFSVALCTQDRNQPGLSWEIVPVTAERQSLGGSACCYEWSQCHVSCANSVERGLFLSVIKATIALVSHDGSACTGRWWRVTDAFSSSPPTKSSSVLKCVVFLSLEKRREKRVCFYL